MSEVRRVLSAGHPLIRPAARPRATQILPCAQDDGEVPLPWAKADARSLACCSGQANAATRGTYRESRRPIGRNRIWLWWAALDAAGVIFIEDNGEGLGVRLRKAASDAT